MKAVIYARVSTNMQAEKQTPISGQIEDCKKMAASQDWEVVGIYKDEGYTGRNEKRPAFQEMIADAKRKKFDVIIAWAGSRIARNVYLRLWFEQEMAQHNVTIYIATEPRIEGPEEEIITPMMAGIDAYLSRRIGQATKRGLSMIAGMGYSAGGNPPKGYRANREVVGLKQNGEPRFMVRWEPDPLWQHQALKAFQMVAAGRSSVEIIKETNVARNVSSLPTLFRNPTYIGERVYNVHRREKGKVKKFPLDDPGVIRVPDAHEAIIPRELWDKVQAVIEARRPQPGQRRAVRHDFLLSGILWCNEHSNTITGHSNGNRRYYACEVYRRGGRKEAACPLLNKDALESFIIDLMKKKVYTPARIRHALECLKKTIDGDNKVANTHIRRMQGEIDKLQKGIDKICQAVVDGHMEPEDVSRFLNEKKAQLARLEDQLAEEERPLPDPFKKIVIDKDFVDGLRKAIFNKLDHDDPVIVRAFLHSLIDKIIVDGSSISVHLKTKDISDQLPANCQVLVAGVGFEPTTSGL